MVVAFWLLAVRAVVRNSPFLTSITENKSRLRPRLTTLQGSDETNCFVAALFVFFGGVRSQPHPQPLSKGRGEWYALFIPPCQLVSLLTSSQLVYLSTRQLINLSSTRQLIKFSSPCRLINLSSTHHLVTSSIDKSLVNSSTCHLSFVFFSVRILTLWAL